MLSTNEFDVHRTLPFQPDTWSLLITKFKRRTVESPHFLSLETCNVLSF
jgi:hypothetical protein